MIVTKHFLFTEGCSSPSYTPLGSYTPPHSKQMLINIGMGGGEDFFNPLFCYKCYLKTNLET